MLYDVIIIGGGPAGCAAAIYAARKKLNTLLLTDSFGGQSVVSSDIQNWIGEKHVSGMEFAQKLEGHVREFQDVKVMMPEKALAIVKKDCNADTGICYAPGIYDFEVKTDRSVYYGKTVILASGARRKKIGLAGESEFDGKGVSWCSTCDAPIFQDKDVAVVGGGNAGLEAAIDLFPYARKIYLLEYSDALKGDAVTQELLRANPKAEIIFNAQTLEIYGDKFVKGLKYRDRGSGKEVKLSCEGVFIEIGSLPNSDIVKDLAELDEWGQVVIDSKYGTTSCPGLFAAGDATDDPFKQNNIAAGDAVKAALSAYNYIIFKRS